jgi:predicted DNA-binding mobile mystery protein A
MSMDTRALARKNLEKRLAPWRERPPAAPARGWLRAIRDALGMTTRQMAARMGTAPSRVPAIEKAEVHGGLTLKTLREAAEALDCTLVYAIVPKAPLDRVLRARAEARADRELARLDHTMRLENQALTSSDLAEERERMIAELLAGPPARLWDEV